ncbi:hypothetical protein H7J86_30320 [Mycobacterium hackensackense]|uniref:hypothetical protein n=1 Tax=Mycobacterium hackensackense TaxID=228909 RepID=UPI002265853B|nr:hypothetical protein [Mycobacterium hackensackense]MCV7256478.1 hypothetical protein [Mycobacterium hackensackense]
MLGTWTVRASAGRPEATVTAPAQDLALWAWTRGGSVSVTGESSAEAALREVVANGMQ